MKRPVTLRGMLGELVSLAKTPLRRPERHETPPPVDADAWFAAVDDLKAAAKADRVGFVARLMSSLKRRRRP